MTTDHHLSDQTGVARARWGGHTLTSPLVCTLCLLQTSIGLLQTSAVIAAPPRDEWTHAERLHQLYGHDVRSTQRGEPVVSVGIYTGLKQVSLYSKRGLTLYLGADPDSRVNIRGVNRWDINLKERRSELKSEQWEILDERPVTRVSELNELEAMWRSRGVGNIVRFQSGLYVPRARAGGATALDGRSIMLAHQPSADLDLSPHLKGRSLAILETLISPARGSLSAQGYEDKSKKRKAQAPMASLSAQDVIWVEAERGRMITVSYQDNEGKERSALYQGELYVVVDRQGLSVVSVLPAEKLIEGVVPSELYRSAPMEALKAQAIAARGQVVVKLGARHLSDPYMLCASTHCQAYKGVGQHHKRTSAATRATRGMIAMTSEDHPLDSVYSSTCGGHTEAYHEVWGGAPKPHLLGVEDNALESKLPVSPSSVEAFIKVPTAAFCQEPKRTFRWRVRRKASAILERLNSEGHVSGDDFGSLVDFEVLRRGVSGRAHAVTYRGSESSVVVYGDFANRVILGVKSGLWVKESLSDGEWRLSGGGFGHGVGMCQHGAMGMAKGGATMNEIIDHYYAGAKVKTLW